MLGLTKHIPADSKLFHFQNPPPEETDQTTVLYFLGDLKKLKDFTVSLRGNQWTALLCTHIHKKAPHQGVNPSFLDSRILNPPPVPSCLRGAIDLGIMQTCSPTPPKPGLP